MRAVRVAPAHHRPAVAVPPSRTLHRQPRLGLGEAPAREVPRRRRSARAALLEPRDARARARRSSCPRASCTPTSRAPALEIMANSDNVLRGGLTPKHVELEELLSTLVFEPQELVVLKPEALSARRDELPDAGPRVRARLPGHSTGAPSRGLGRARADPAAALGQGAGSRRGGRDLRCRPQ